MDDVKTKRKHLVCKIAVIILFVLIAILMSNVHERWSDEAQSFLIARDNSLPEIITQAKYEGTTPMWFVIVKFFLLFGGTYETLFLLPLFFSVIGLIILEFKVKTPWYIKVLLPFTFFILYQYTVVARSYCMIFPALMWIVSVYKDREKRVISYNLALLFLMSICSYTLLIAGSLWFIDFIKMIKQKKYKKKNIIALSIMLLALVGTFALICPNADCSFNPHHPRDLFSIIYQATFGLQRFSLGGSIFVTGVFFLAVGLALSREEDSKQKTIWLVILFLPLFAEHALLKSEIWHIGIITLLIYAAFMMNDMINKNMIIKFTLVIMCLVQIVWSGASINYDILANYSGSKNAAEFIKQGEYKKVFGLGFDTVALQPYFDHNIYDNLHSKKSFWQFKENNGYTQDASLLEEEDAVFVIGRWDFKAFEDIYKKLLEKGYVEYYFNGAMVTKTFLHETKGYYILTPN